MSDDKSMALLSAARQEMGSQAHRLHPSLWDSTKRHIGVAASSAAASWAAASDGEEDASMQYIQKNNLMTAFFNNGKGMNAGRLDAHGNNTYLGEHHFIGVAEASQNLIDMLERTEKYDCMRGANTDLACFVHRQYYKSFECVCHGKAFSSKYAIFRIVWDGRVGGSTETVVAVFHVHYSEAKRGQHDGWDNMRNKLNQFMTRKLHGIHYF